MHRLKGIVWGFGCLFILLVLLILFFAKSAEAADPELLIEYQGIPPTPDYYATEYQLKVDLNSDGTLIELAVIPADSAGDWEGQVFGIPLGKTLNYYLGFTDNNGAAGLNSPAYPFKLRGQGTIINMRRIK